MEQIGYVTGTVDNMAQIDIRRTSACGSNCSSCGGSCDIPSVRVMVNNSLGAIKGDYVEIKMATKSVIGSAVAAYLIPLILMIAGIGIGVHYFKSAGFNNYEALGLLSGLACLGIAHLILKRIDRKISENNMLDFEMVKILNM